MKCCEMGRRTPGKRNKKRLVKRQNVFVERYMKFITQNRHAWSGFVVSRSLKGTTHHESDLHRREGFDNPRIGHNSRTVGPRRGVGDELANNANSRNWRVVRRINATAKSVCRNGREICKLVPSGRFRAKMARGMVGLILFVCCA